MRHTQLYVMCRDEITNGFIEIDMNTSCISLWKFVDYFIYIFSYFRLNGQLVCFRMILC